MSEIELKCAICKGAAEMSEKDSVTLGNMSDEYEMKLPDYLVIASTIIRGNQKCSSGSGKHAWIFSEQTEGKINGLITQRVQKNQQLMILVGKDEKLVEGVVSIEESMVRTRREFEERMAKMNQELENKNEERKGLAEEKVKVEQEVVQIVDGLTGMLKMKRLDKFL